MDVVVFLEVFDDGGGGEEEALPFPFGAEPAGRVARAAEGADFLFVVAGVAYDDVGAVGDGGEFVEELGGVVVFGEGIV